MNKKREQFLNWVVYQIYPRSFYDSNGDGIGDLNGVIAKLDYLVELGINAIWLCPCYKSPNYDNGYDVSNYRDIMDEFGTLEDWKRLRAETKKRGIKIIMDLVFNHTSFLHPWFQEAKKSRDNSYHDYYIWRETPPNTWQSVFGGDAWEYNKATKEYYLHSFAVQQPDLNWENPQVRKECRDIVDYWVKLGVDGFRCDVLDFIAKDFATDKMYNGPKLHEYLQELFGRQETEHLFLVGECQSKEEDICKICGPNRHELTTVFQFDHINLGRKNKYRPSPLSFDELRDILVKWQRFSAAHNLLYTLFTDNHDNAYFLSRTEYAKTHRYEVATALASMFFLLRGIPFIYQTQEYGAINPHYGRIDDFSEVETIQYYNKEKRRRSEMELVSEINVGSRDNTRRPFAWNGVRSDYFGFSTVKPWITLHSDGETVNLETDMVAEKSVFAFYKKLLALRKKSDCLRLGDFADLTKENGQFVFKRTYHQQEIFVICNFEKQKKIPLPFHPQEKFQRILNNYADAIPFSDSFHPFEIAVYEKNSLD